MCSKLQKLRVLKVNPPFAEWQTCHEANGIQEVSGSIPLISTKRKRPESVTVSVHKEVFSYERLVATSAMEAAAFSLSMVDHGFDDSAIASISFMVARSTSPTPVK